MATRIDVFSFGPIACIVSVSPCIYVVGDYLNTSTPPPPAGPARWWTRCTGLAGTLWSFDAWYWSKLLHLFGCHSTRRTR